LAAVTTRVNGQVLNVSSQGVKVRVTKPASEAPRVGDVYRILSSKDTMLAEVCYSLARNEGTDIGFKIVYWSAIGELNRAIKTGGAVAC